MRLVDLLQDIGICAFRHKVTKQYVMTPADAKDPLLYSYGWTDSIAKASVFPLSDYKEVQDILILGNEAKVTAEVEGFKDVLEALKDQKLIAVGTELEIIVVRFTGYRVIENYTP